MSTFPKWQYTADPIAPRFGDLQADGLLGRVIHSAEEIEQLGGTWYDTPSEVQPTPKTIEPEEACSELAFLRAKLDAAGIAYDKRWGVNKLKEALNG